MKLRKALGIVSNEFKDAEKCECCGEEFKCGISLTGCWCLKVELNDKQRADLKSKFKNCLCPSCLNAVSVQKAD